MRFLTWLEKRFLVKTFEEGAETNNPEKDIQEIRELLDNY